MPLAAQHVFAAFGVNVHGRRACACYSAACSRWTNTWQKWERQDICTWPKSLVSAPTCQQDSLKMETAVAAEKSSDGMSENMRKCFKGKKQTLSKVSNKHYNTSFEFFYISQQLFIGNVKTFVLNSPPLQCPAKRFITLNIFLAHYEPKPYCILFRFIPNKSVDAIVDATPPGWPLPHPQKTEKCGVLFVFSPP